ncbi:hypothetical protein RhiirC2_793779 [Rhizophagus irregularis]|uniref:Uncharacterized protein n=1 Tax=Rhizophagus irregularis TaxID=588596 RepID=A0A2N1MES6_9GLOM|nr:hypothetical protein RhiirC2_793779 [Rhizophagus irregularis]
MRVNKIKYILMYFNNENGLMKAIYDSTMKESLQLLKMQDELIGDSGKCGDRAIQDKTDVLQGKRTTKNELETAAIKNNQKRVTLVQGEREDNGMDESGSDVE